MLSAIVDEVKSGRIHLGASSDRLVRLRAKPAWSQIGRGGRIDETQGRGELPFNPNIHLHWKA